MLQAIAGARFYTEGSIGVQQAIALPPLVRGFWGQPVHTLYPIRQLRQNVSPGWKVVATCVAEKNQRAMPI